MEEIVHLFFYVADEGGTALGLGKGTSDNPDDHLLAFGSRNDVGNWQLHLESKVSYHSELDDLFNEKIREKIVTHSFFDFPCPINALKK